MKTTYLVAVSVLMLAIATVGLLMATVMVESLPAAMPDRLDSFGDTRHDADDVTDYRALERSGEARFLAGDDATTRLDARARAFDADPKNAAFEAALADEIRDAGMTARRHAVIAIVMLGALAFAGLLGIARLRVPTMVAIGSTLLGLTTLMGVGDLMFGGGAKVAAIIGPLCAVALIAQLIAANLLPGAPNALIAQIEAELRGRAPHPRSRYLALRIGGGFAVATAGTAIGATAQTVGCAATAMVLLLAGAVCATVPTIAWLRIRLADAELPAARVVR